MGANFHTKQLNPLFWVLKRCIPMDVMVIGKGTDRKYENMEI